MDRSSGIEAVEKVVAYITREVAGKRQLLVFTHRDHPEAGVQVPGGTVEAGESVESALLREVEEETGLAGLPIVGCIALYDYYNTYTGKLNHRHVYHLLAPPGVADTWTWVERYASEPEGEGEYVFDLYWHDLDSPIDLAGSRGDWLHEIGGAAASREA